VASKTVTTEKDWQKTASFVGKIYSGIETSDGIGKGPFLHVIGETWLGNSAISDTLLPLVALMLILQDIRKPLNLNTRSSSTGKSLTIVTTINTCGTYGTCQTMPTF
jgi:hypothetical protein